MEEIGNSLAQAIRNRSSSATLGTYTLFWILLHAQGLYVTLFVSQDLIFKKYGLLKNEYVYKYFFGYHAVDHLNLVVYHTYVDWHFIWSLILPLVLTIIFVWFVPRLFLIYAYKQEQEHKTAKREIKYTEERKIAAFEKKSAERKTDAIEAEIMLSEKTREAEKLDPEIVWSNNFEVFKNDPAFQSFSFIISSVYDHNGHTKRYYDRDNARWIDFEVPSGTLALADSNGLITLDNANSTIMLTEKGKYFVRRFPSGR